MQCSIALDRKTPLLRSARNLDGMVSRFLASRLWSKVPVKAKAHVRSRSGREVSRSRVAEWEEPRHPGTASQEAKYPTSPHSATQNPSSAPHRLVADASALAKVADLRGLCGGTDFVQIGARPAAPSLHRARSARGIAGSRGWIRPFGGRSGRNWRQRVVSAGISAAATSSSTAGTSRSVTTSWIFGAAFAACSDRCGRSERARLGGLGGERAAEWGAVSLGSFERGDELRDAGGGRARLELRQRLLGGLAHASCGRRRA